MIISQIQFQVGTDQCIALTHLGLGRTPTDVDLDRHTPLHQFRVLPIRRSVRHERIGPAGYEDRGLARPTHSRASLRARG